MALSKEQNELIDSMYTHRVKLHQEAARFTIRAIAAKVGCCPNTVWGRINGMINDVPVGKSYAQVLEEKVKQLEEEVRVEKLKNFKLSTGIGRLTSLLNKEVASIDYLMCNLHHEE